MVAVDRFEEPQLRRAWLRGYRAGDVELALAQSRLSQQGLDQELDAAKARGEQLAAEVKELRERDAAVRAREVELVEAANAVRAERERLETEAQTRARELVAEAESRAAAFRTEALRRVEELQHQSEELMSLRGRLLASVHSALDEIGAVVRRVESDESTVRPLYPDLAGRLGALGQDEPGEG